MGSFLNGRGNRDKGLGQKGFTLVEVMVALGVLAFGILAIASMQMASLSGTNLAAKTTEGTTVGMDRIEQFVGLDYDDSNLAAGNHGPVTEGNYQIIWTVTEGQPLTNTKTIDLTVQWQEKGVAKTASLTYVKMDII